MIDSYIQQFITDQHIPGLALAIQRGETIIHEGYYGLANLEHQVAVTADSVFEIASISKLFTAQAVLRLVQDGRFALTDTIATVVEGLPEAWQKVTIEHCLAHQSGIPNYTAQDRYWALQRVSKSPTEVLDLVRDLPVNFSPGQRHSYDNTGYYLLGMVIESVSKQPYADVLRDLIFAPLGMNATCGNNYDAIIPHRVQGYTYAERQLINKRFYDISNTFSAGILLSNIRDLLAWRKSWFDDSILNADYRKQWWTPHLSAEANEKAYHYAVGLGWFMVESKLGTFLGHNGGIQGYSSALLYLPQIQMMGVALYNRGDVDNPHQLVLDLIAKLNAN